jgi:hypothetical protein
MSLLEVQNFLARVFTDEELRREFLAAPEKVGAENNLSEAEILELQQMLPAQLNFFGDSLVYKRLREVEKLLPLTRKALGRRDFENLFREFAARFLPQTIKKHLEDAIQFAGFLEAKRIRPAWTNDLIGFERAKLIFHNSARRFLFKKFDCDVREIIKNVSHSDATPAENDFPKRKTLALWIRVGRKTRLFIR